MSKFTLFIADLHLSPEKQKTTTLFLNFLKTEAPKADALYILGDLFKLWIGDDDNSAYNGTIKAALMALSMQIPVYFLPGNRDFLLGEKFALESGCKLINDPCKIDLYGTPTVLTHGDMLYTSDKLHVFFRAITRPKILVKIFLKFPFKLRSYMANAIQKYSSSGNRKKVRSSLEHPQKNIEALLNKFNCTQIIYGHIHSPSIKDFKLNGVNARCIIIDEWSEMGSTLVYSEDNTFEFRNIS